MTQAAPLQLGERRARAVDERTECWAPPAQKMRSMPATS